MNLNKYVSKLNKMMLLLILLGSYLSACRPSSSAVETAIAETQAAVTMTPTLLPTSTSIPTSTPIPTSTATQGPWKVIQSIFSKEQQNDSEFWQGTTLASNIEFSSALEMKLDMESTGANIIVLTTTENSGGLWWEGTKRMEIACEEGTLGIFLRDGTTDKLTYDNNLYRPSMPIIDGVTNCQITVKFDQFGKHVEIFQDNRLIFEVTPEVVGDFPEGLFPSGQILKVELTSGPKEDTSTSGIKVSSSKLNELIFSVPPND